MRSTYCDNDCLQNFILPFYYSVMAEIYQEQSYLSYNPGHNILRNVGIWENFGVTTSETNRDH